MGEVASLCCARKPDSYDLSNDGGQTRDARGEAEEDSKNVPLVGVPPRERDDFDERKSMSRNRRSTCTIVDLQFMKQIKSLEKAPTHSSLEGDKMEEITAGSIPIFDVNLHGEETRRQNVQRYYAMCKEYTGLHVTTSTFSIWREHKKSNGYAKVIPAVPSDGSADKGMGPGRIFFFDDNLEWGGKPGDTGICNLRDVRSGEFVDFMEGTNGFRKDRAGHHTVIHYSTEFRNVLVKANILDAINDPNYFDKIIKRYILPGEKIIVFMDVNSTIVCNDTVQSKDLASTLRSTMFEFVEFQPREPMDFKWKDLPETKIAKMKNLKAIVKDVTGQNREAYASFWDQQQCDAFFETLQEKGTVRWAGQEGELNLSDYGKMFDEYLVALKKDIDRYGIASSWYTCYRSLQAKDVVMLNSFGVDTRKVVLATVADESKVMQITVNHELWEQRDVNKFEDQFVTGP